MVELNSTQQPCKKKQRHKVFRVYAEIWSGTLFYVVALEDETPPCMVAIVAIEAHGVCVVKYCVTVFYAVT